MSDGTRGQQALQDPDLAIALALDHQGQGDDNGVKN